MNKYDLIHRIYNNIPADPPKLTYQQPVDISLKVDTNDDDDDNDQYDDDYDDRYDDYESDEEREYCRTTHSNENSNELFRRTAAVGIAAYIMHRAGF